MTKSCVAVTVRIKPLDKASDSCGLRELDGTTLQVPKQTQPKGVSDESREFKVDSILGQNATQEECFQAVATPLIHSLLDGYNGTILAYGQTGCLVISPNMFQKRKVNIILVLVSTSRCWQELHNVWSR